MTRRIVLFLPILLVLAPALAVGRGAQGDELAVQALSLMQRALRVQPPERLSPKLRRRVTDREAQLYEEEVRHRPGVVFFEYPLAKEVDPTLYRDLKKFWKLSPARKLSAAPGLGRDYLREEEALRGLIFECLQEIQEDALDVPDRNRIMESVWVPVLDAAETTEERLLILDEIKHLHPLSDSTYQILLDRAQSWGTADCEVRARLVDILQSPSRDATLPRAVEEFVFEVARRDGCPAARVQAISYAQIARLGTAAVLPVYMEILKQALREGDAEIAARVLSVAGVKHKAFEMAPGCIAALDSTDPAVRAEAVNALEKISGIRPEDVPKQFDVAFIFVFSAPGRTGSPSPLTEADKEQALSALRDATARWEDWWLATGLRIWSDGRADEFRAAARSIYR